MKVGFASAGLSSILIVQPDLKAPTEDYGRLTQRI